MREARIGSSLTQAQLAAAAGVSQGWISKMELGRGTSASLETWSAVADALGTHFVGFLEDAPGTDRPRDYHHLTRQELVLRVSAKGSWSGRPEQAVTDGPGRWRYADVLLHRDARREMAVVEIWDWLDDVGNALRGLSAKVQRVAEAHPDRAVSGVLVIRGTARNPRLVAAFPTLFSRSLPAPSMRWLRALTDPEQPMPTQPGMLWTDVGGSRLFALRRNAGT